MSPQILPPHTMPSETENRARRARKSSLLDKTAQEEDARLRNDIRLLGRVLGDTVRDQEGADVFDLVERIRQTSVRFHRDEDKLAPARAGRHPRQHVDRRDAADRPRLQLFLPPRQHRRGPEQHPPDAQPRPERGAAAEHAGADPGPCPTGRHQPGRSAQLLQERAGQSGADRASDRGPPQEHDGPRDGDRRPARSPRAVADDAGRERGQRRAASPRGGDAVADQSVAPDQADRARRGRQRPVVLRLHLPAGGAAAALRAGGPAEQGGRRGRRTRLVPAGWEAGSAATATAIRSSPQR